jgi:hypothetical protein
MRLLNILHVYGVDMVNYVVLCIICFYQTKKRLERQGYVSFLATFGITLFTGVISFFAFAFFIFVYSRIDPYLKEVYLHIPGNSQELTPFILIFFEGSAAVIIISLIVALYSEKLKGKK